jgi:ATP-dependent helicase HrpB
LELPTLDLAFLQEVAAELCRSRRSLAELRSAPWVDWIRTRFTNEQWIAIEKEAPPKIMVPSGNWIKIRYEYGKPPTMAVKIQEIFSWRKTPTVAMGRIPILLELLSPNMRPQQITNDLVSFWENGYPIVKKELKRRYPKHSWPDDPLTATPGRR